MDFQAPFGQPANVGRCEACGTLPRSPQVQVGDIIHGHGGGYFGRESYNCKRVEAVGPDWVVAREVTLYRQGDVLTATGRHIRRDLMEYTTATDCDCLHSED